MNGKEQRTQKKRALIVGGGRFLGYQLCDILLSQNLEVIWFENSIAKNSKLIRLLDKKLGFKFYQTDLINFKLNEEIAPQYIFQLGGIEAYLDGDNIKLETLLINSQGTQNLLEIAKQNQSKFLLVSSVDIYSGYLSQFDLNHYFGYGQKAKEYSHHEAKRYAEALASGYHQSHDVDVRIVRLADVYGPGMNLNSTTLINRLFHQVANNEPITIAGDGLVPVRPTYISDVIYGLVKAMFNSETNGKIFSLINPEELTMINLAYLIREITKNAVQVLFIEEKEVGPRYAIDREILVRTQKELGWRPKVKIRQGTENTIAWIGKGEAEGDLAEDLRSEPDRAGDKEVAKVIEKANLEKKEEADREAEKEGETEKEEIKEKEMKLETKTSRSRLKIKSSVPIGVREKGATKDAKKILKIPRINFKFRVPTVRFRRPKLWGPSRRIIVFTTSLMILIGFGLVPPTIAAASGLIAVYRLQNAVSSLKNRKIQLAERESVLAKKDLERTQEWIERTTWLAGIIGKREELEHWRELTISINEVAIAMTHVSQAAPKALSLTRVVLGQIDEAVDEFLRQVKVELDLADDHLALAEARLKKIDSHWYPKMISSQVEGLQNNIPRNRNELTGLRSILQLFPRIVGTESQRTYLILLQNNMELRPGGGFIGSFGIVRFINGRMVDFKIEDVYNADGQLQEEVVAPEPFKVYLKQPNWYLRDSNWSPHFPTNAAQAQWFIKHSLGIDVDGVVAFDLSMVKKIIEVLGPIDVPDFQTKISAGDLFEKTQTFVEKDFFPGSSQKRDFMSALARAVIQKVVNSDEGIWPGLMKAASEATREKHLLVHLVDPTLNQLIDDRSWSGSVPVDRKIVSGNHFRDFLMVVDANLGANKANYFVRRAIYHQVVVDREGNLAERVTIEYDNQSPAETWPGGVYTNYLRVYVNSGAVLQDVRIDNRTVPNEVTRGRELGKTVWSLPIQVPIKSKLTVSFEYHLSQPLVFEGGLAAYELSVMKQAGTVDDLLRISFNYPSFYQVLKSEPTGKSEQQAIIFSTTLEQDRSFKLELVK